MVKQLSLPRFGGLGGVLAQALGLGTQGQGLDLLKGVGDEAGARTLSNLFNTEEDALTVPFLGCLASASRMPGQLTFLQSKSVL